MESWQILLILGIVLFVVFPLVEKIDSIRKSKRQKRLDKAAREMLVDFDFNKEISEIKSISSRYVSSSYRCPRCGGVLVMRNGRYGKFWGCNRFPNCKYTRDMGG